MYQSVSTKLPALNDSLEKSMPSRDVDEYACLRESVLVWTSSTPRSLPIPLVHHAISKEGTIRPYSVNEQLSVGISMLRTILRLKPLQGIKEYKLRRIAMQRHRLVKLKRRNRV